MPPADPVAAHIPDPPSQGPIPQIPRTKPSRARATRGPGSRIASLPVLIGLASFALYALTCSHGAEWQDSGVHQYRILTGTLEHPWGLALSHPLHYWLGRAILHIPAGAAVYRLNLLSSVFGAMGIGLLAAVLMRLTRSRLAALLAAAAVALAHSYWQMSALAETYTLAGALLALEWALLLLYVRTRRPLWLVAVFAANGLHVADHLLGLLTLPTYSLLLVVQLARQRLAVRHVSLAAATWLLAAAPYWTLVLSHYQRTGDVGETVRSALFGGGGGTADWSQNVLNTSLTARQLKLAATTFGYCFPSAAGLVAIFGLTRRIGGRRRLFRRVLLAQTVLVVVFIGRYTIKDLYTYFVPVCLITGLWFGIGMAGLLRRLTDVRARRIAITALVLNAALPLAVYTVFPRIAAQRGWLRKQMRDIPFRDEYTHFLCPWRAWDDSPTRFARDVLARAGPEGWILADSTTAFPLAVTQLLDGSAPDVRVYWMRLCLTPPPRPDLTDGELLDRVTAGGRVIATPGAEVKPLVREPLYAESGEWLWQIRLRTPPSRPADG